MVGDGRATKVGVPAVDHRGEYALVPHYPSSEPEYGLLAGLSTAPARRHQLLLVGLAVLVIGLLVLTGMAEQHSAPNAMGSNNSSGAYPRHHAPPPAESAAPDHSDPASAPASDLASDAHRSATPEPDRRGASAQRPERPDGPMNAVRGLTPFSTSTVTEPLRLIDNTLLDVFTATY